MKHIVNLTTHPICLFTDGGQVEIQPTGLARVELEREVEAYAAAGRGVVPIHSVRAVSITGLPPADGKSLFVVSAIVERYAGRKDVVTVDKLIRGDHGLVLGAAALSRSA